MKPYDSVLVTGGAGFIGSRMLPGLAALADRLTVFDNLSEQVHGASVGQPALPAGCAFVLGDVRDRDALAAVVAQCRPDLILHLAAETGTGQSFDEIGRYCDVNVMGTANLIEALRLLPEGARRRRFLLASTRAVYGEGAYLDNAGQLVSPPARLATDMAQGRFLPLDADGRPLTPVATPESLPPNPSSIYASTKLMQEMMLTQALADSATDLVLFRLQNVYGAGQSLKNPYTGVLSIFAEKARRGERLDIYEDGDILRDFVHVSDVGQAFLAAARIGVPPVGPINIGTNGTTSIHGAAALLLKLMERPHDALAVTGQFRAGDIRHARADITRAKALLGWSPRVSLADGLADLLRWIDDGVIAEPVQPSGGGHGRAG